MRMKHSTEMRLPITLNKSESLAESRKSSRDPKKSMSRTSSQEFNQHLGPGCYIIDKSLELTERNKRTSKIGNQRRFSGYLRPDFSPGPKYNSRDAGGESHNRNLPKISFSKDKRFSRKKEKLDSRSPSPAHYDIPSPRAHGIAPIKLDQSSGDILDALRASKIRGPGP